MARIVWFHPRQLLPPRGGGELRGLGLVQGALEAGHEVLLVHPDDGPAYEAPLPDGLQLAPVHLKVGVARAISKVLSGDPLRAPQPTRRSLAVARRTITDFAPDIAIVSQVMSWSVARRLLPEVAWAYDAHNVEQDLFRSHLSLASTPFDRLTFMVDSRRVSSTERRLLSRASEVLAVSSADAAGLARVGSPSRAPVVVPSSMTPPEQPARPSHAPPTVLFVGTLNFPPNIEAVTELMEVVMPAVISRVPEARLLVAGRQPSGNLRARLRSEPWIDFVEDAPRIADLYLRARCAALPFRSGAGTKLKLFEALSFAVPVVATQQGVAGVEVAPGAEVLIGQTASAVADWIVAVLTDLELADRIGSAGRLAFDERLSWERAAYPALWHVLTDLDALNRPHARGVESASEEP